MIKKVQCEGVDTVSGQSYFDTMPVSKIVRCNKVAHEFYLIEDKVTARCRNHAKELGPSKVAISYFEWKEFRRIQRIMET